LEGAYWSVGSLKVYEKSWDFEILDLGVAGGVGSFFPSLGFNRMRSRDRELEYERICFWRNTRKGEKIVIIQ
jgi:hypothetical protein